MLLRLGGARALVVHGEDGVDELSLSGPTRICEVDGETGTLRWWPRGVRFDPATVPKNDEFIMAARRRPDFAAALAQSDLNIPDGANLVRAARWRVLLDNVGLTLATYPTMPSFVGLVQIAVVAAFDEKRPPQWKNR